VLPDIAQGFQDIFIEMLEDNLCLAWYMVEVLAEVKQNMQ
jgi:hypothetical protein